MRYFVDLAGKELDDGLTRNEQFSWDMKVFFSL